MFTALDIPALAVKSTIPAHEEHTASCQKGIWLSFDFIRTGTQKGTVSGGSGIKTDQHRCDQNSFFVYNLLYIVSAFHKNMKK